MKSLNIFLLLLIFIVNSCSSSPEEHLVFNDIPIHGNPAQFANELTKSGFTISQVTEENQIKLNGVFLEQNCEIYVYGTKKSQLAYKVRVNLPAEVRDTLQLSFEKLQKLYTSKYGKGKTRYQQYRNPERLLFNEPRLKRQIKKGDITRFTTDSGHITIEVRDGYISITYLDKINNEVRKREIEEENNKEIQ